MIESQARAKVVEVARSWLGTPFHMNGCVKGVDGGVDCLRLIWRIFGEAGIIPEARTDDPWPHHDVQRALHSRDEVYIDYVLRYADEVEMPGVADVVLVRRAREDLSFSHAGLVTRWPMVIHVMERRRGVCEADARMLKGASFRFFDVFARRERLA